jgi:hypothetical protein
MLNRLGRSRSFNVCLVLGGFQMPVLHEGLPMMENFTEDIHWVHHGMWTMGKANSKLVKRETKAPDAKRLTT